MDVALRVVLALLVCVGVVVTRLRGHPWHNPVVLVSIFVFLPLYFSLMRLSGLQSNAWRPETYLVLYQALAVWLLLPIIVLLLFPPERPGTPGTLAGGPGITDEPSESTRRFHRNATIFALLVMASYALANVMQAGRLVPAFDPALAEELHTVFPRGIRVLCRQIPLASALLLVAYRQSRRYSYLALAFAAALLPATRLARLDIQLALVTLVLAASALGMLRLSRSRTVMLAVSVGAIAIALAWTGNQRMNLYGLTETKITDVIDFRGYSGPSDVLAYLYLAFPFSFENLNRYIAQRSGGLVYGLSSFDWLFSGFLKMNLWFGGYDRLVQVQFDPGATGANVPTVLATFYNDFGAHFAWLPMLFYVGLWLWLYRRAARSPEWAIAYALLSAGFSVASFQGVLCSATLFYQLAAVAGLALLARAGLTRQPG